MQKFAEISSPLDIASKAISTLADGIVKLGEIQGELSVLADFPFDELEDLAGEIEGKAIIQIVLNGSKMESNVMDQNSSSLSAMSPEEQAKAAGYNSVEEYKSSNYQLKSSDIMPLENRMGSTLTNVGTTASATNTVVVNNNSGGNVSNVNTSNVNNMSSAPAPIITGSAMALF